MHHRFFLTVAGAAAMLMALWLTAPEQSARMDHQRRVIDHLDKNGKVPLYERVQNDWFMRQRMFPSDTVPTDKYYQAIRKARAIKEVIPRSPMAAQWQLEGPSNIPGRITDIEADPGQFNTVWAATAAGGLFKSLDGGNSWTCMTDEHGMASMGDVALDPTNPDIVYAGTGEANCRNSSYEGNGVYKSTDGGMTWTHLGLESTGRIARILVDPLHPDTLFLAALGSYYGTDGSGRGIYRSFDGGTTWEHVRDDFPCIDIVFHPGSGVLVAALWDMPTGKPSGIIRSTDLGTTWTRIADESGLPPTNLMANRIGLAMDPESGVTYAMYSVNDGDFYGLYKSTDTGLTWTDLGATELATLNAAHHYGWYFGQIRCAPGNPDLVFATGFNIWRSDDGGDNFYEQFEQFTNDHFVWDTRVHVDQHALYIDPLDHNNVYSGNDGGVYKSTDGGLTWTDLETLPATQFYAVACDYHNVDKVFGGTQDNGTIGTFTGAIDDWELVNGGDGFVVVIDYSNPDIMYAESQYGYISKSTNGGQRFFPATDGLARYTEPYNWCTPIVMDPNDPNILYTGSNRVYRTTDGADYWYGISPTLTMYTITTIAVAPSDPQVVWAGSEEGAVWVTTDGGANWDYVAYTLPMRWVTRIAVDPLDASIAYVTHSGYRDAGIDLYPDGPPNAGELIPYIHRTTDHGQNWTDITGDLPQSPVNDIIVDPQIPEHLMIGSDVGVYESYDIGATWTPLGEGLPITVVMDLDFHMPTRTLYAGTHGRSIYSVTVPCGSGADSDGDYVNDACDNCPGVANASQDDTDFDLLGDACDDCTDSDGDGYGDPGMPSGTCPDDNCPEIANVDQLDADSDGIGDACDDCTDLDGDGYGDPGYPLNLCELDNCPEIANPDQADLNGNGIGDACESCCGFYTEGFTGNCNCSDDGKITLSDISILIDRLFISKEPLCCEANGNTNGSEDGKLTLSDVSRLIDKVYISKEPTAPCAGL